MHQIIIQLKKQQAKDIADILLKADIITPEDYDDKVKEYLKPVKTLFG